MEKENEKWKKWRKKKGGKKKKKKKNTQKCNLLLTDLDPED